jgi:hypothetical protein
MIILKYKSEYIKHNEKWKLNSESIEKIKEIDYNKITNDIKKYDFVESEFTKYGRMVTKLTTTKDNYKTIINFKFL